MLTEIKTLLTNKLAVFVMLLTLLWIALDSGSRLLINQKNNSIKNSTFNATPLVLPQPSLQTVAKLNAVYNVYRHDKKDTRISEQGLSLAEQAKQHGELKKLFIGDNKLELKAVISVAFAQKPIQKNLFTKTNIQQLTALIAITNIKTGKQQIEKYANNSLVYGYLLTIEKNTQVALTKKTLNGQQQSIVLTMYKGPRNLGPRNLDPRT
ncbi:MAG: hypothetical protein COA85_13395 [Robiginitomaculum sp.]|nr:MAG: hypothetical protein COA85_13395 [Robiginitomaculum sp.]